MKQAAKRTPYRNGPLAGRGWRNESPGRASMLTNLRPQREYACRSSTIAVRTPQLPGSGALRPTCDLHHSMGRDTLVHSSPGEWQCDDNGLYCPCYACGVHCHSLRRLRCILRSRPLAECAPPSNKPHSPCASLWPYSTPCLRSFIKTTPYPCFE